MNVSMLQNTANAFAGALECAAANQKTSLPYIRHTLSTQSIVPDGAVFQTLVIGGSFYQKALMRSTHGKIQILEHAQGAQPSFGHMDTLMAFVKKHTDASVKVLALNFAYPLEPLIREGCVDGTLQSGSKENTFDGLVGRVVGECIEKYFRDNHDTHIKVSAANDTICLLLSGLITHKWHRLAAGIVGTGLNFALFLDKQTVVNIESANFDVFEQSPAGKHIDNTSVKPGEALYEKEVSGAYLYKHFNYLIDKNNIKCKSIASTKELDTLAKSDNAAIARIARGVIRHSASLVAAQIAGILQYQRRDLVFIMQGSLFWRGRRYKEMVHKLVCTLAPQYSVTYEQVLYSDLYGAAHLVV